jgi:excinuclease ABC subunit C
MEQASRNATEALERRLAETGTQARTMRELTEFLELPEDPRRIEIYDNSHIQGVNAVGAMVVAGPEGFLKNQYRKFNIKHAQTNDDFGMMREVMGRRFARAQEEDPDRDGGLWPDLVLIDGGKGQLSVAMEVFAELGMSDVVLMAVAKGQDRRPGQEQLLLAGRADPLILGPEHPALHLVQQIRDEAHRFAIQGHRARRGKTRSSSSLETIPGIGSKRRQRLLARFGGLRGLLSASVDELAQVEGISRALAEKIYHELH